MIFKVTPQQKVHVLDPEM